MLVVVAGKEQNVVRTYHDFGTGLEHLVTHWRGFDNIPNERARHC